MHSAIAFATDARVMNNQPRRTRRSIDFWEINNNPMIATDSSTMIIAKLEIRFAKPDAVWKNINQIEKQTVKTVDKIKVTFLIFMRLFKKWLNLSNDYVSLS